MQICFATNNLHKIDEVRHLLGDAFQLVSLEEAGCTVELPENQQTLEGNSIQKAAYIFHHFHIPCFADDSGLEVEALNGAPGAYSARYAGAHRSHQDNMDLLLKNLEGSPNRKAQFRAVITFMESGQSHQFEGIIRGTIITTKKGTGGFGYDPIFLPEGSDQTFAEMSLEEKNKLSHRAIAIRKFVEFLNSRNPY